MYVINIMIIICELQWIYYNSTYYKAFVVTQVYTEYSMKYS